MRKFIIAIEETVVEEFEIETNDAEEALSIADEAYRSGKLVLEPGEVQFKQMAIINPKKDATEWIEF